MGNVDWSFREFQRQSALPSVAELRGPYLLPHENDVREPETNQSQSSQQYQIGADDEDGLVQRERILKSFQGDAFHRSCEHHALVRAPEKGIPLEIGS